MNRKHYGWIVALGLSASVPVPGFADTEFFQTNLVSDLSGVAAHQDTNLVNPWGLVSGPATPIWIGDNGAGVTTVYTGTGTLIPIAGEPSVTIPPPAGGAPPSAPDGVIFNSGADFGGAHFLFATEDGTIAAWSAGNSAALAVDNSGSGAVYKGLASGDDRLYAANFNSGAVDVFDSSFHPITVPGGFTDPNLPTGFAPFNIANIGGLLYVTYAKQDAAKHDDVAGTGNGFVDVYDLNGVLQRRLVSNGALDSPWGLALAPTGFGSFSNDLLVGNFGDGTINAFNPTTGALVGTLSDSSGKPIVNEGLWGIMFGNGAQGTSTDTLYFTAGIPGPGGAIEDHGLFGDLRAVPEPGYLGIVGFAAGGLLMLARLGKKA